LTLLFVPVFYATIERIREGRDDRDKASRGREGHSDSNPVAAE
jgi:hypothetical protein